MYLIIDNTSPTESAISWFTPGAEETKRVFRFPKDIPGSVIRAIVQALPESAVERSALQGIGVIVGTGGFTAGRVGVTVANTLAFAWGLPVAAIPASDRANLPRYLTALPLGRRYAQPAYGGAVRLGGARKINS